LCGDTIEATINGVLFASNYKLDSVGQNISGSQITITVYTSVCGFGLPVINPFSRKITILPLSGGTYNIKTRSLVANCSAGTSVNDSLTNMLTVATCCPATADLSASDTVVCEGGTLTFTDTSSFGTAWWWKEDGVTFSTAAFTASRTFNTPGYYTIRLVTGDGSCMDSSQVVIGVKTAPTASFNFVPNLYDYQFYDQSTAWKPEFMWDFGDTNSDTAQHPAHTYADTGNYIVCLTVTNTCGSDSACQSIDVTCPKPVADFVYSADSLTVDFTDSSANSNSWYWTFGDGNFSAVRSPSYTYPASGTYTVCLHVDGDCGSDTLCMDITVGDVGIGLIDLYGLKVYPNPATDQLTIAGLPSGDFSARFYDVLGRASESPVVSGRIDLELLPGAYVLEVMDASKLVYRGKIIIR
jgi:PKD repeat protein